MLNNVFIRILFRIKMNCAKFRFAHFTQCTALSRNLCYAKLRTTDVYAPLHYIFLQKNKLFCKKTFHKRRALNEITKNRGFPSSVFSNPLFLLLSFPIFLLILTILHLSILNIITFLLLSRRTSLRISLSLLSRLVKLLTNRLSSR